MMRASPQNENAEGRLSACIFCCAQLLKESWRFLARFFSQKITRAGVWETLSTENTAVSEPCSYPPGSLARHLSLAASLSQAPECVWNGITAGALCLREAWWPLNTHPPSLTRESLAWPHLLIYPFNSDLASVWGSCVVLDAGDTKMGKSQSLPSGGSQPTGHNGKSNTYSTV